MKSLLSLVIVSIALASDMPTGQVDLNRTGWNSLETTLTPRNVVGLRLLGSDLVDGPVWGQPVIGHGILVVCTMNNTCYGYKAGLAGSRLWKRSLGITPRSSAFDTNLYAGSTIGCLATPAIDLQSYQVFVVCGTSAPSWVLFSISLTTGAVINSVTISGFYGSATFDPSIHMFRPAVTIASGSVYLLAGSYGDLLTPWHGWAFAYSESTLTQQGVFCTTPSGNGGSFWSSGGGPVVDDQGNLYAVTGNGDWDGISKFSDSVLKLSPTLQLLDWFTPSNYATLNVNDLDPSSNRLIRIPGTSNLVMSGKDFNLYVLSMNALGHLQGTGTAPTQAYTIPGLPNPQSGAYGSVYMNGVLYLPNTANQINTFVWNSSTFNTPAAAAYMVLSGWPGPAAMSGSSNGAANSLLWFTTPQVTAADAPSPSILRVMDPQTGLEVWNSHTSLGTYSKFSAPVILDGFVYASSLDNAIRVFTTSGAVLHSGKIRNSKIH